MNLNTKFIWIMIMYIINMIIHIIIFNKTFYWYRLFVAIILAVFLLEKSVFQIQVQIIENTAISNLSVLPHKNKCFWKVLNLKWLFKITNFTWIIFDCDCEDLLVWYAVYQPKHRSARICSLYELTIDIKHLANLLMCILLI